MPNENRVLDALEAQDAAQEALQATECPDGIEGASAEEIAGAVEQTPADTPPDPYLTLQAAYDALQKEYEALKEECRVRAARLAQEEEFSALYPDIALSALPDCVTQDASLPLAAAYALYERRCHQTAQKARAQNEVNLQKSAGAVRHDGASQGEFSLTQIKQMTGKEVRKYYSDVLRSLRKTR